MGLYDGFSPIEEEGSTAHLAKLLKLPVVLVVDASSMARSIVPLIMGFKDFDPQVNICGVILNKVGSDYHKKILKEAISHYTNIKCFGFFKKRNPLKVPSRHLGLYTAEDNIWNDRKKKELTRWAKESITQDFKKFYTKILSPSIPSPISRKSIPSLTGPTIAVAYDRAFCFYYEENLNLLKKYGACVIKFSPLEDSSLPRDTDVLYLGGGYPELYAHELSQNISLKKEIKEFADKGGIIYAECGGFMYLMESISDNSGMSHEMVGIFPFHAIMQQRLSSLGYREVVFTEDTPLGPEGTKIKGHEFHYSTAPQIEHYPHHIYKSIRQRGKRAGSGGVRYKNTIGSYIHLHFGSNFLCAKYLVHNARFSGGKCDIHK